MGMLFPDLSRVRLTICSRRTSRDNRTCEAETPAAIRLFIADFAIKTYPCFLFGQRAGNKADGTQKSALMVTMCQERPDDMTRWLYMPIVRWHA